MFVQWRKVVSTETAAEFEIKNRTNMQTLAEWLGETMLGYMHDFELELYVRAKPAYDVGLVIPTLVVEEGKIGIELVEPDLAVHGEEIVNHITIQIIRLIGQLAMTQERIMEGTATDASMSAKWAAEEAAELAIFYDMVHYIKIREGARIAINTPSQPCKNGIRP